MFLRLMKAVGELLGKKKKKVKALNTGHQYPPWCPHSKSRLLEYFKCRIGLNLMSGSGRI